MTRQDKTVAGHRKESRPGGGHLVSLNGGDVDALISVCAEGQHLEEVLQVRVLTV